MRRNPVKVCVRTRPTANFAQDEIVIDQEQNTIEIKHAMPESNDPINNKQTNFRFQYHHVLHQASQDTVYELARHVVQGAVDGVNGTILSYGQTGSGKTFTMIGDTRNYQHRGVAPRALAHIFQEVNARVETQFTITCSYLEIYNERIFDLLADHSQPSQRENYTIMEDTGDGMKGIYVRGLTEIQVNNEQEAMNLLYSGELARTTAQHKLNRKSNRSHCIYTIYLQHRNRSGISERITCSKLHLVDLAGSERLKKTLDSTSKNDETIKKESMYINQSLSYLEQCVVALSRKSAGHVPYRQTKLTNILKDSLGGNCNTLMFACIWGEAAHLEETTSTLRLAARMMRVQNESFAVEVMDPFEMIKKQERQLRDLKQELLMHDALAERSGVQYDPLTPEQLGEIRRQVEVYIEAPFETEEDSLPSLQSIRQIKEMCRQFKLVILEQKNDMERQMMTMTSMGGYATQGDRSDSRGHTLGTAHNTGTSRAIAADPEMVGEEEGKKGFSLGIADAFARPATVDNPMPRIVSFHPAAKGLSSQDLDLRASKMELESLGSPALASKEELAAAFDELDLTTGNGKGGSQKARAYEIFKRGEGKYINDELTSTKASLRRQKQQAKAASSSINKFKQEIAAIQSQLSEKKATRGQIEPSSSLKMAKNGTDNQADDIMDEEEFRLIKKEREAKRAYKAAFENLRFLKEEMVSLEKQVDSLKYQLISDFEAWHAGTRNMFGVSQELTDDEDKLDDAEAFEKMEMERIMSQDPESLAFFQAQKTRIATKNQNSLALRQMHKNKRIR